MVQFKWTIIMTKEKIIGVTEFKAKCLNLVTEVASGKTRRVILTRRGRPVAELKRISELARGRSPDPWGRLKDLMRLDSAVDLTAPSGLVFDAESGKLYNE